MAKNFPEMITDPNLKIQKAQRPRNRKNTIKYSPRLIFRLQETKDKEKNLKVSGWCQLTYRIL